MDALLKENVNEVHEHNLNNLITRLLSLCNDDVIILIQLEQQLVRANERIAELEVQ